MSNYGSPVFPKSVSFVTAVAEYPVGTRRTDSAGNEYVYGCNASANSIFYPGVPGVLTNATTGHSFTVTNAASQVGLVAAVCHHATIPTGNYGWFMTRGLCRAVPDSSQVEMAAGEYLAVGVDGGFVSGACGTAMFQTGLVFGLAVESIVTGYGSCASEATSGLGCLGRAWINCNYPMQ